APSRRGRARAPCRTSSLGLGGLLGRQRGRHRASSDVPRRRRRAGPLRALSGAGQDRQRDPRRRRAGGVDTPSADRRRGARMVVAQRLFGRRSETAPGVDVRIGRSGAPGGTRVAGGRVDVVGLHHRRSPWMGGVEAVVADVLARRPARVDARGVADARRRQARSLERFIFRARRMRAMLRRWWMLAAGWALASCRAPAPAPPTDGWTPMFDGVEFRAWVRSEPRLMRLYAARIDLHADGVDVLVTPGNGPRRKDHDAQTTSMFA